MIYVPSNCQLSQQIGILLSLAQFTNNFYHLSLLMDIRWISAPSKHCHKNESCFRRKKTSAAEVNDLWKEREITGMNLFHSKHFWGGRTGSVRPEIAAQESVGHERTQGLHCTLHSSKPQETGRKCICLCFSQILNYNSTFRAKPALNVPL